ncbi:PITH domain-containing [Hyphodiscus hymeniophilus]|uniref:PITH domain-containing n=1 Tax=Hyphodiscus hymeniophilus TaxID=353542 RepID=A0A9P6VED8_9HELO|nr:PITH domain-containing [Hyphodiscus hymeniophilus]
MIDHQVTDLSYGHLGEVTYDIDSNEWCFSVNPSTLQISQLLPLKTSIPPSIYTFPSTTTASEQRTLSTKLFLKSWPEAYPAQPLLSSHLYSQAPAHSLTHVGQLLAIGRAVDIEKTFGSRKTDIIATACGEAGHVLRLIKPRVERHEWGRQSSLRLSTLDAASSDQGYWVGTGGRILQISCAEDENGPTTRLAVRQANATTIFRPLYEANLTPAVASSGYAKVYPASRINANPIAILTAELSGSRGHADVTWNPWYSRQFAVVDAFGSWTICDIEGGVKKNISARLITGKSGNIYDGFAPDPTLKAINNADGWHQILWVGTVGTIVVCNRRHLAVFNVKSAPTRIQSKDFFSARNTDWILDMKRSPSNASHLFVLTSSRIFWLEVLPAGVGKGSDVGYRTLLSYRHFRDANDSTMRLAVMGLEDGRNPSIKYANSLTRTVSIAIFSEKSAMLNIYTFWSVADEKRPTASQASLNLSINLNDGTGGEGNQLQSLLFLDTPPKSITNRPLGPEHRYINEDVKFYQLLVVSSDLGLMSGLCTVHLLGVNLLHITPPTRTYSYTPGYLTSKRVKDDPWIIPDEQVDAITNSTKRTLHRRKPQASVWKATDETRFAINFRLIFEQAFNPSEPGYIDETLTKLLETTLDRVKQAKMNDDFANATFLELSQIPGFAEDLEQGAPILRMFLESLGDLEEPDAPSTLVLSNLTLCPGIDFHTLEESSLPDLLKVYEQTAQNWIASLPLRVPGMTRLAKFKVARKLAVELYLSSIGISLRDKASEVPSFPVPDDGEAAGLLQTSSVTSRQGSPALFSSQLPPSSFPGSGFGLPTPEQTPSLYSHSLASGSDISEDPAISRLRQYTVSIKSKPDLGVSKMLSHWPVAPGVDPATYSYELTRKKDATYENGEENSWKKRNLARRKKRTERFLSRHGTAPAEISSQSQPRFAPFGSQPDVAHLGFSSQTVENVPMTQPDRGAFGSRTAQSHSHSHGDVHDHSDDITPALQYSLYQHINFDDITTLNESEGGSGKAIVKKTWAERLQDQPELESDADEQLLMHIPFTGQVKLHSILIRTSNSSSAPQTLKVFINRDDLDFSTASDLSPTQEFSLSQTNEIQDISVKRALFGKVQSLNLFVEDNHGDDVSRLSYLGFKGDWMQLGRAPTNILYEAAANPADHAIKGTDINKIGSSLGGGGKRM